MWTILRVPPARPGIAASQKSCAVVNLKPIPGSRTTSALIRNQTMNAMIRFAVVIPSAVASMANPGPHGFTEVLYAYTSQTGNNGSAFAGLNGNILFYNLTGAVAMLVGRFWMIIPAMALAGSLAAKK